MFKPKGRPFFWPGERLARVLLLFLFCSTTAHGSVRLLAAVLPKDSPCCKACIDQQFQTETSCRTEHRKQYFYNPNPNDIWTFVDWTSNFNKNEPTQGVQTASCRSCPSGWFRDQERACYCTRCNPESCNTGEYASGGYYVKKCSAYSDRVCLPCRTCGIGTEQTAGCRDPHPDSDVTCPPCESGKYRSTTAQSACQNCAVCSTAQRQRNTPCTTTENNRCTACALGQIVTGAGLDTCSTCGAGKYADNANNVCADCRTCARTHRQTAGCAPEGDRQCEACPPETNRVTTVTNSVHCAACREGYYNTGAGGNSNEPSCAVCATSVCAAGTYVSCTTSDLMGSRSCLWCQGHSNTDSTKCAANRGVPKACFGTSTENVQCMDCPAGTERPEGTPMVSVSLGDRSVQIQQCMACGTGKYKLTTSNTACIDCTNKPDNSQYVSWGTRTPASSDCPW